MRPSARSSSQDRAGRSSAAGTSLCQHNRPTTGNTARWRRLAFADSSMAPRLPADNRSASPALISSSLGASGGHVRRLHAVLDIGAHVMVMSRLRRRKIGSRAHIGFWRSARLEWAARHSNRSPCRRGGRVAAFACDGARDDIDLVDASRKVVTRDARIKHAQPRPRHLAA